VSERDPIVPACIAPARSETLVHDDDRELDVPRPEEDTLRREGLPAGFQMRHDAHYVEQLTTRTAAPHVRVIPLRDIEGSRQVDSRELAPLVRSISKYGVLQPLLVRPHAARFELIAGTRRLAAAVVAGLSEVPCIVHHVDDARARALAEADNLRSAEGVATQVVSAPSGVTTAGLRDLSQSFTSIDSCLHLLADRETVLKDRVTVDLIRTEVQRAGRLVQCLNVLGHEPMLTETDLSLATVFSQVLEGFAPERRLSGVDVSIELGEGPHIVPADPQWLSVGLSSALAAMLALVQGPRVKSPALRVAIAASPSRSSVMLEISQQAVAVPPWTIGRFFDAQWTDRPGGSQAAMELAAARKVVHLHRGGIEIVPGERGGCRLVLLLPAA
jgi:hypothetical protein